MSIRILQDLYNCICSSNTVKRRVEINGETKDVEFGGADLIKISPTEFVIMKNGQPVELFLKDNGELSDGLYADSVAISVEKERDRILRERFGAALGGAQGGASGAHMVKAPMPGLVRQISVQVGDMIEKNSTLLVLEAMKMENNIAAGVKGQVIKILVEAGASVDKNAKLIEIEIG